MSWQHHPDRWAEKADGQGGANLGGDHQAVARFFEPGGFLLRFPERQDFRVRDRPGGSQNPPAKEQVGEQVPPQDGKGPRKPEHTEDSQSPVRYRECPERAGELHGALQGQIEVIWQQPEKRAAAGTEGPAQQGQQCHQKQVVDTDMKEDGKGQGEKFLLNGVGILQDGVAQQHRSKEERQQHGREDGGVAQV